jgi:pyruvate/2-oxoglutarate dehydrogenase complex dihydrolipoamide acyltransferase (E2) component
MPIELKVPVIGESVSEIFIGQWYKGEGSTVAVDENLVELESEKATLDVPSPSAGVITKILKQAGETAEVGEVIAYLDADGAPAPAAKAPEKAPEPAAPAPAPPVAEAPKPAPAPMPEPPKPAPTPAPAAKVEPTKSERRACSTPRRTPPC